jgi:hypothetical protein
MTALRSQSPNHYMKDMQKTAPEQDHWVTAELTNEVPEVLDQHWALEQH